MSSFQPMPMLFPPEYPDRPDAPLLAFGASFAEEIARSVIAAVWYEDLEHPEETEVRVAAALTMLEAFHPRDHLECMLAAQGVAAHAMIMDCHRRCMDPDTTEAMGVKLRGSIAQMSRVFSTVLRDMERRQTKPLPERPLAPPADPAPDAPPSGGPRPPGGTSSPIPDLVEPQEDLGQPEDIETRPDGTPGSLAAYAPKPVETVYIPREPAIMLALATRPKPWRMVNDPAGNTPNQTPPQTTPERWPGHGPLDSPEKLFSGDALSRFASTRFDPDAPVEPPNFDDEYSEVDLELFSTGGDPELEAERQALISAHPEGKPIKTIRHGQGKPPKEPPSE